MARIPVRFLEVFFLSSVFVLSATISLLACEVTNRQIIESNCDPVCTNECVTLTIGGQQYTNIIYKREVNRITFSDGDFDNLEVWGLGGCDSPSVSGSQIKCYPAFNTPATVACNPASSNCARWKQFVLGKMPSCGFFSCSCVDGSVFEEFYLEGVCQTPEEECSEAQGYWIEAACEFAQNPGCEPPDWGFFNPSHECQYWYSNCQCLTDSPILIDVSGNGFALTDVANGVPFDMPGNGVKRRLGWTTASTDDAWLVLDRNGNGWVDSGQELFGNYTAQPEPPAGEKRNGFLALAEYDKTANGGNNDGKIDGSDAIFSSLRLWRDTNHNGTSEEPEWLVLSEVGLKTLDLDYQTKKQTDTHGNGFRYRAKVRDHQNAHAGRWAWDVFLVSEP